MKNILLKVNCERCGKEYLKDYTNHASVHVGILSPEIMQDINIIELCDDCQRELLEWVEKGVNNGK